MYLLSGDCQKELGESSPNIKECIEQANQLYNMAYSINEELKINSLTKSILQKKNELDILCKANGVTL